MHGEIGLINIPSSRMLDEGTLKLHLSNSEPINSLFITAYPFNWMEVSLRYADINTAKYSQFPSFSGDQTYKDKSFNLKLKLIEETERFPELSIGFRDFIYKVLVKRQIDKLIAGENETHNESAETENVIPISKILMILSEFDLLMLVREVTLNLIDGSKEARLPRSMVSLT